MNDKSITKVITKVAVVLIVFILSAVLITTLILDNIMPETGFEVDNKLKITRLAITIVGSLPFAIGSFFLVDKLQAKKERERLEEEIYGVTNYPNQAPQDLSQNQPNMHEEYPSYNEGGYGESNYSQSEREDYDNNYEDLAFEGDQLGSYEGDINGQQYRSVEENEYMGYNETTNQQVYDMPEEQFLPNEVELPEYTVDEFIPEQPLNSDPHEVSNDYKDKIEKLEEEIRRLSEETKRQHKAIENLTTKTEVDFEESYGTQEEWDLDEIADQVNSQDQYLNNQNRGVYLTEEERNYLTQQSNPIEEALNSYQPLENQEETFRSSEKEVINTVPKTDTEVTVNFKEDYSNEELKDDLSEIEKLLRGES